MQGIATNDVVGRSGERAARSSADPAEAPALCGLTDPSAMPVLLPELYKELRHRRDTCMKFVVYYLGLCAASIGWVVAVENPIPPPARVLVGIIVLATGGLIFRMLTEHWKTYAETARVIVSLSKELGCFDGLYPERWNHWGEEVTRWPQLIMLLCGVATAILLFSYAWWS